MSDRERNENRNPSTWRIPLLAAAIAALLAAGWAGLVRMGWQFPVWQPSLAGVHGPLIVSGFFGTLITLERAVALGGKWPYTGVVLSAAGGIALIAGIPGPVPALLLVGGSLGMTAIFAAILRRHRANYTLYMAAGALSWAAGNLLWLAGKPVFEVVLWWMGFLILTIAGERLELGRLIRLNAKIHRQFNAAALLFIAGLLVTLFDINLGARLASLGMLSLAVWMLRYDISRFTIKKPGVPRFAAACLLSGYAWLGLAGVIGLIVGLVPAGPYYDAFLHAVFLGFVFAMIFGHAPIIFPAILRIPISYSPFFYSYLFLLHISLTIRIIGDLVTYPPARLWGGLLNGIAILAFLLLTVRSVRQGMSSKRKENGSLQARPEEKILPGEAFQERDRLRWTWHTVLGVFILAALTGSLLRFWMLLGFPDGVQFPNVRHAHSHLMYFGWVTPALMALITARLPLFTSRKIPKSAAIVTGTTLLLGLLSYPAFFLWGYDLAVIGGVRLPISVIVSSLNMLAWYAYIVIYRRMVRGVSPNRPIRLWNAALLFLVLASLGAWGRAVLVALKIDDPFWTASMVHLFLDLFSSGWAILGVLGLAYSTQKRLSASISGWEDPLLFLGLPLTFLLGVPADIVPTDLRTLSGIGGLMAAGGLFLHARILWQAFRQNIRSGWVVIPAFLSVKALFDIGASISPLAAWGEQAGLRVLYLHITLLGLITLGIFTAAKSTWRSTGSTALAFLILSVLALLASLLPLSGLWPESWGGIWTTALAAGISLGPSFFAGIILFQGMKRRKSPEETGQEAASPPVWKGGAT